ncbi:AraC family transcriptional regulator [Mesorhizobium sp. 1M-11]|uniref:helix-turn-helix domain-containing protein n=1 Tax=Mesorhizobium sp. 1M-11 TaxID=1529006 RepID=UPI000AA41A80|nr:AraC family transcriptional regulator [Mesorhizobium sp. 1M-11]
MLNGRLKSWGPQILLKGAAVAHTRTNPDDTEVQQSAHCTVIHLSVIPEWGLALNSDRKVLGIAPLGAFDLVPANNQALASWTSEKSSLRVDIDPARPTQLAGAEFDTETFELHPPKFGFVDKRAHMLASYMLRELENRDPFCEEALDALVIAYSIYLIRAHSTFKERSSRPSNGGLPPAIWKKVRDFIEENLDQSLSVEQLASVVRLSPSHFIRAFRQTTGQPPHQFVISARLARARNLIVNTDTPLSLIAKSTGFASSSHMTTLMKRTWNATPSEIRKGR